MALFAVLPIMIAAGLVLVFRFINQKYKPPIFGVYQQKNKFFWFKFTVMYIYLRIKQLYIHLKGLTAVELGWSDDGTVHIHAQDVQLEQKYDLADYEKSVDAVYFNGVSKDGTALITNVARRPEFFCDAFMFLKIAGEDLLLSPELPDTTLKQTPAEERQYRVGGIHLSNVIPMRTWKVHYDGEMKYRNSPEKRVKVQMDLTWSANWPAFNFDNDLSPLTLAQDLAREPWSADYFKLLQKTHQTHYEQMGFLNGSVFVDGKEHQVNMPCVRDHTFGKHREWRNFHRYVLQFLYLENGDCIAVGAVSQPIAISQFRKGRLAVTNLPPESGAKQLAFFRLCLRVAVPSGRARSIISLVSALEQDWGQDLTLGYLCRKSDQAVLPVKGCDFQLWQHGENQTMPKDYGFTFHAGGQRYDVQIQVMDEDIWYIGKAREAKFYPRWASAVVNGVKGWGVLEWHYNNVAAAS